MLRARGAERSQCRLLSVRQSERSADVQPLIGPIGLQGRQMLVALHVPEFDDTIFSATGDRLAIGADAHGAGPGIVRLHHSVARPLFEIPPAHGAIRACAHQNILFTRPVDAPDEPAMAF